MRFQSILLTAIVLTPSQVIANEYQRGYSTQSSCFRNVYRETYIPGTKAFPGYVKSFTETIKVPCRGNSWRSARYGHYHPNHFEQNHIPLRRRKVFVTQGGRSTPKSCSSGNVTTGGLIGGGIAAALSKKDAYGWSVPLGAVLGMGIANSNC